MIAVERYVIDSPWTSYYFDANPASGFNQSASEAVSPMPAYSSQTCIEMIKLFSFSCLVGLSVQ